MNAENIIHRLLPWNRVDSNIKRLVQVTPGPLCVACSGGPDSMALFALVKQYWGNRPCILLHYNHRVREASQEEEAKLLLFAKIQGIKIEVGHRPNHIGTTEVALREARYHFFQQMMRLHGASLLFLGHHQDDLFETVIMRLVRGSSLEGLIAPKSIHKTKYCVKLRPLLNFSKSELITLCERFGIPYFTDSTNASDKYLRNRVRHHVLTTFDSVFNNINWRKGFAETCRILAEHRDFSIKQEELFLAKYDLNSSTCARDVYCECTRYERRIFLKKWFEKQNVRIGRFETMDQILDRWDSNESFFINLDSKHGLKCECGNLSIVKKETLSQCTFRLFWRQGKVFMPNRCVLEMRKESVSQSLYRKLTSKQWDQSQAFVGDAEHIKFPLCIRTWQSGDAYRPLGKSQIRKVKDMFSAQKITAKHKHSLPVVCNPDGSILWIPGLPPADISKVTDKTKMCIFLFYQKL